MKILRSSQIPHVFLHLSFIDGYALQSSDEISEQSFISSHLHIPHATGHSFLKIGNSWHDLEVTVEHSSLSLHNTVEKVPRKCKPYAFLIMLWLYTLVI